jgi:hypothetical protein
VSDTPDIPIDLTTTPAPGGEDPVIELRRALVELNQAVGKPSYPKVAQYVGAAGRQLGRSTMYDLRKPGSSSRPTWDTVEAFVWACLQHARRRRIDVPEPWDDLRWWRDLHERCPSPFFHALPKDADAAPAVATTPPVRSYYLEQVRRIAPQELLDRSAELAELTSWCTATEASAYSWWRAPAWFGKSGLLSWFVLHPPPDVVVVSFFITARLSAQNDKQAFTEVVLEQLAEILRKPLPSLLTDATRDAHVRGMLAEATTLCREEGRRLLFVVDGLDEDRGMTGVDGHSIAALLPEQPHSGLRVLVSGRPNPPIPPDVPAQHPLRDPGIVRELDRSEHAEVARIDAERELVRLLRGTPAEQDLLGLITAAGGGLSGPDLAELTGWSEWEIDERLTAVSGRTFSRRNAHWDPFAAPSVYLLAHEQLQQQALSMLGRTRLDGYRQRLHLWAQHYHDHGWPIGTPEYLLRGYYLLLRDTNEVDRLMGCALDRTRHDRMLDMTGGDSAALAELITAQDIAAGQPEPDLLTTARLAVHRRDLADRNTRIPPELPAAWATLGNYPRAEALARSLSDPFPRASALAALVGPAVEAGDIDKAAAMAADADAIARTIIDPSEVATITPVLVAAVARAGNPTRAETLANSASNRVWAWLSLVDAVAKTGDTDRTTRLVTTAETILREVGSPKLGVDGLTTLAKAAALAGDTERATALLVEADAVLRTVADPTTEPGLPTTIIELASATAAARNVTRAKELLREAWASADADPYYRSHNLCTLMRAATALDDAELVDSLTTEARTLATSTVRDTSRRCRTLIPLVRAVAMTSDTEWAATVATQVETLARTISDSYVCGSVIVELASVVMELPDIDRAVRLARTIEHPYQRAVALTRLIPAIGTAGDITRAATLAEEAEALARTATNPNQAQVTLTTLVTAVAAAGDVKRAESLARKVRTEGSQTEILMTLVAAIATVGETMRAQSLSRHDTDKHHLVVALAVLAVLVESVAAEAGTAEFDHVRALHSTNSYASLWPGDDGLVRLVRRGAKTTASARAVVDAVNTAIHWCADPSTAASGLLSAVYTVVASTIPAYANAEDLLTSPVDRDERVSTEFVREFAARGELDQARSITDTITMSPYCRAMALTHLIPAISRAGDDAAAAAMVTEVEKLAGTITDPPSGRGSVLVDLVIATAVTGDLDRAEALISTIPDPTAQVMAATVVVRSIIAAGDAARAAALALRAEATAATITWPEHQVRVLAGLAGAMAAAGDTARAEALALGIADRDRQTLALADIASSCVPPATHRVVASALRAGDWTLALGALTLIQPSAVTALAADFLGDEETPVEEPTADDANQDGGDHSAQDAFRAARDLDLDTLQRRRRLLGDDHPETMGSVWVLMQDLFELGELAAARELGVDSLARYRRVCGDDHEGTLIAADNLALVLRACTEWAAARELHHDLLLRRLRLLGEDDPASLASAHNLSIDLYHLGEWTQARDLDEDTLRRRSQVLGDDHPDTLRSEYRLVLDLGALDELRASCDLNRRHLARCQRILGENHPETLWSQQSLTGSLHLLGETAEACELGWDLLRRLRQVFGEDHADTLVAADNVTIALRAAGAWRAARDLDEDTLRRRQRVFGHDHPTTLQTADNLTIDLRAIGGGIE